MKTKRRMSSPMTPEHKAAIAAALKGRVFSAEHRENLRIANTGKKHSSETREKISLVQKGKSRGRGRKMPPEFGAKVSAALKGRKCTEQHRENIRLGNIKHNAAARLNYPGRIVWNKGVSGSVSHTPETRQKISEANKRLGRKPPTMRKEMHYNWKGGITPEKLLIRGSVQYSQWRTSVFERDGWRCRKYNISGEYLVAHHIVNFADDPSLRFCTDNGITLSRRAHLEFHKKYGFKHNTREQIDEFLAEPVPPSDPTYLEKELAKLPNTKTSVVGQV